MRRLVTLYLHGLQTYLYWSVDTKRYSIRLLIINKTFKKFLNNKIVQAIWIRQKNMAARGRGLFSLYIYI